MATAQRKPAITRMRHELDARALPVGRLASTAARLLMGKHKPAYQPHVDQGDFVNVINAKAAHFSGRKLSQKIYRHPSGYPGGLKQRSVRELTERQPGEVIRHAVEHMLPKNRLRGGRLKRLTIVP